MKTIHRFEPLRHPLAAAVVGAFLLAPALSLAADQKPADKPMATATTNTTGTAHVTANPLAASGAAHMNYSDREYMKGWSNEKEQLEKSLKLGEAKAYYPKALADHGYMVTSVNSDKADKVEYEVVKGNHSYEVQIDFDKAGGKATKVDVTTNMWRTDATKAAMRGSKPTAVATLPAAGAEMYSDRARMKQWTGEKEKLEKSLALGHDKGFYANELKKQGYQITSTNDSEKDYLEYEVVKGDNSYEVQIDLDGGKAKKVDVTTNMWQSDATERALEQKHASK